MTVYPIQSGKLYHGEVVENADPQKRGRVKVKIELLTDKDIKTDQLPWYVVLPTPSASNNQTVSVPSKGTFVFVSFPNADIYNGIVVNSFSTLKAT